VQWNVRRNILKYNKLIKNMNETTRMNISKGIENIAQLLSDEDSEMDKKNKNSPPLGRTLDGQTGYFIGGRVQTLEGQNHQGYGI